MTNVEAAVAVPVAVDTASTSGPGVALALKGVVDRVGAAVLLLAIAPALLFLVAAVRLSSSGPALFTQPRRGRNGEVFHIVKLRTMVHGAEAELADAGAKRPADPRITPLGRVLRRWSLDELPNLWNVLRGDMSLVGPRPDLLGSRIDELAPRRLDVRPGLTGLWQVSGRCELDVAERARLDTHYVEQWSFGLDARILVRTVAAVIRGTGAY